MVNKAIKFKVLSTSLAYWNYPTTGQTLLLFISSDGWMSTVADPGGLIRPWPPIRFRVWSPLAEENNGCKGANGSKKW